MPCAMNRWQVLADQPAKLGAIILLLLMQLHLPMLQFIRMCLFIIFYFEFWNQFIIYFCDGHLSSQHRDLHVLTKFIAHEIHQNNVIVYLVLLHALTSVEIEFLQTRHNHFACSAARCICNFYFYFLWFYYHFSS